MSGGSAGGFTALLVCIHHGELVRAAVVQYPVADLADLAATTHRFESRYSDRLVGELPARRGPLPRTVARDARGEDPDAAARAPGRRRPGRAPAQVDRFVDAVRAAGGSVDYHRYAGEGHGWSRPETVADALRRIEAFLSRF